MLNWQSDSGKNSFATSTVNVYVLCISDCTFATRGSFLYH